jgi:hypothetical protein
LISAAHKGRKASPETLEKLKARRHTEESKERIRMARIGKTLSESGRRKISLKLKGNTNARGRRSLEARERMRQAALNRRRSA